MLNKIMSILNKAAETQSSKTVDPELQRITPMKFRITNFEAVVDSVHRSKAEVSEYILKQLKCEGGLDQDNKSLLIKQRVNLQ